MSGDLVAVWEVALSDGVHRIEFEHGTTTGKRVINIDGKVKCFRISLSNYTSCDNSILVGSTDKYKSSKCSQFVVILNRHSLLRTLKLVHHLYKLLIVTDQNNKLIKS